MLRQRTLTHREFLVIQFAIITEQKMLDMHRVYCHSISAIAPGP